MNCIPAGTRVEYSVTWLELLQRPDGDLVPAPRGEDVELVPALRPPFWYFLCLYDAVGRDYAWEDMHEVGADEIDAFLGRPETRLYTMLRSGWPQGYFILDASDRPDCRIACFGLVEEAIGRGLGSWLLDAAVDIGWKLPGVKKMSVDTCTLDHQRALPMYMNKGFVPVREEKRTRVLTRDIPRPPEGRIRLC